MPLIKNDYMYYHALTRVQSGKFEIQYNCTGDPCSSKQCLHRRVKNAKNVIINILTVLTFFVDTAVEKRK